MSKQLWDAIEKMDVDSAKSIINSIPPAELSKPVYGMQERTVLQRAVSKGLTEVVQLIIDRNSDTLQYECSYGRFKGLSLLYFAIPKTGSVEVADLLFNHPQYNFKAKAIFADKAASREILKLVIQQGFLDLSKWYFDKIPAITTMMDKEGQTALHWAIHSGNIEVVKFFLNKMSDKEFNNFTGSLHPLRFSTSSKKEEITKLLLDKTSLEKLKYVDEFGGILHCAVKRNLTKIIDDILPKFSAEEIIATNESGHTPLYYAYERDMVSYASRTLLPVTAKAYEFLFSKGFTYGKLHPQVKEQTSTDTQEMKSLCDFAKENECSTLYEQLFFPIFLHSHTTHELLKILQTSVLKGQHEILSEFILPKLFGRAKPNDDAPASEKAKGQTPNTLKNIYARLENLCEEINPQIPYPVPVSETIDTMGNPSQGTEDLGS